MFVTSYSVTFCTYISGKPGFCFHYNCAVCDEWKLSDTFLDTYRIHLLVHYSIALSSLWKLIWRHWIYKMPVSYISSSEIKHSLGYPLHNIWDCVFSVYPFPLWWLREYAYFVVLSSSNWKYELISIVKSWNNGKRCMSPFILTYVTVFILLNCTFMIGTIISWIIYALLMIIEVADIAAISRWRHQMETFPALLARCAGNSPVPVKSPHKGQ